MKGTISPVLLAIGLVIAIAAGVSVSTPTIRDSIVSIVTGMPHHCNDAPYDWNCICNEGEEKHATGWGTTNLFTYGCRPKTPNVPYSFPMEFTDVNDQNWQAMVKAYSEDKIKSQSNCISECPSTGFIEYGIYYDANRIPEYAYADCREQTDEWGGISWYRVVFKLEDGSLHPVIQSYCKNSSNDINVFGGTEYQ